MELILTAVIVVLTTALFLSGKIRSDFIAIASLILILSLGLITPEQGLLGFANSATVTIGAMFVVSMGLTRTGLVQWIARHIDAISGRGTSRIVMVISIVAAGLSAFIVNTATVAIFLPIVMALSKKRKISSSLLLIPLSFASQFGGVNTLIGTSTNLIINSIGLSQGLRAFSFFEFLPLGLIMTFTGICYLTLTSRWLLPKRKGEESLSDKYRLNDYEAELHVLGRSDFIGDTWTAIQKSKHLNPSLSTIIREGKPVTRPVSTKIHPGDILILNGNIEEIIEIENAHQLDMMKNAQYLDQSNPSEVKMVEILVPPDSDLIGTTIRTSSFFRRYRHPIVAIQRRGKTLKTRLADTQLEAWDTLLIHGHEDDIQQLMDSGKVIVTNELSELSLRKEKSWAAISIIALMVILTVFEIVPVMVAALIAAASMVLTRCITIDEAYKSIDWKIIMLLGGIIPLGIAIEQNGIAGLLADNIIDYTAVLGPTAILAILYIVVAVLTEGISNNAAAIIMAPIAFNLAFALNVDPRPFLVAITFAASTSFATPIGYQTNTMVYAPGGYRFGDFSKIGVPLNLIFWGLAVVFIPIIWPF